MNAPGVVSTRIAVLSAAILNNAIQRKTFRDHLKLAKSSALTLRKTALSIAVLEKYNA